MKAGRPSSFTKAKADRIIDALRKGMPYKLAAAAGGVSFNTFVRWRNEGAIPGAPPHFRKFLNQVREAEAEAAERLVGLIEKAAKTDWRAGCWILEKRFPDIYGKDAKPVLTPLGAHQEHVSDYD